jgi:hypothetical protein
MIALMLLTTLLIAFAVLAKSEPTIAANQTRAVQARAMAEAGMERAMWALTSTVIPETSTGAMAGSVANAPYDGSTYIALGTLGGFVITVAAGTAVNERVIDAVGYAPSYVTTGIGVSHKHLHMRLTKIKWLDPPSALSVRGELKIEGSVLIDSRDDTSCGPKGGVTTTDATSISGGAATVYGYGDAVPNETAGTPPDIAASTPTADFDAHIFTDSDLDTLRSLAKCCGTYVGPGSPADYTSLSFGPSSVTIAYNAGNPFPKNGLIFVDTKTGANLTPTTADSEIPTVKITGNAAPTGQTEWSGWLIVNGKIDWQGNTKAQGLVYAVNDLNWAGTETIDGAVMSRNIKDTSSTNIDSDLGGTATVNWNCSYAKSGAGTLPTGWFLKSGSYREVSD